ncbi:rhodanese-like domain-containing protein [Streptomyces sp. NPDC052107]|uniref:rhodanese-like domain-containing protein n=1 Tax=Streptomyces sp. NPDC052107 TaxID=3155632 RepID=UPI00342C0362
MAATPRPGRITPAEAHTCTQAGEAVLLDVREETEHAAGHAPGAIWLSLGRVATGALLPEAVKGRPVLAICRSGNRSQKAAELLIARGIEALNVDGGMQAWAQAGLPVRNQQGGNGKVA